MSSAMVRPASAIDAPAIARVVEQYVEETFSAAWGGTAVAIASALDASFMQVLVSERDHELLGLVATVDDYDLHHCVRGLRVIDLFVDRSHRGRGFGAVLLANAAHYALVRDFEYLRGEAVRNVATRRLFERLASNFGDSYNVAGRALTLLAGLRNASPRSILSALRDHSQCTENWVARS